MTRPDPNSAFRTVSLFAPLGLILGAALCWSVLSLPIIIGCALLGLLVLTRVPRRLRMLEVAVGFAVLGSYGAGPWMLVPCTVCALSCLLAPEKGLARLSGMDRFMIVQEYQGFSINSHYLMDTDRALEPRALEAALNSLLDEVPLLRSFVREGVFGVERFYTARPWVRAADLIVISKDPVEHLDGLDVPFDLHRMPPVRVLVRPREEGGWRTILSVHHSLCDGTGQVVLFDALMRRYTAFLSQSRIEPVPHLVGPYPRLRELLWPQGPLWMWRMIRRHVKPAAKVGVVNASVLEDENVEPTGTRRPMIVLERDTMDRVWKATKGYRATRNHLYLAAALRAAESWRRVRGKPARTFRVLTAIDLRSLFKLQPGLGNYSGILNLDFTPTEITGDGLLDLIKAGMKKARELEEAIEAPLNLGVVSAVLPVSTFRKALKDFDADPNSFFFSFGFTAVNFPASLHRPGDVEVERVWMSGSATRHPGFGVGPVRDRERVYLAAVHRIPALSEAGAMDYLRRFSEELDKLIDAAPERKRRAKAEATETLGTS